MNNWSAVMWGFKDKETGEASLNDIGVPLVYKTRKVARAYKTNDEKVVKMVITIKEFKECR